jgi:hypothetical protein
MFFQLKKTKKLSKLRKDFLEKLTNAESKGDYEKEFIYYKAEIRTLQLSHKVYMNFKIFLEEELKNEHFSYLSTNSKKNEEENTANFILLHFKNVFEYVSNPGGELDMLVKVIEMEIDILEKFQNQPEYLKEKIAEIKEVGLEEKTIERFEEDIKKKIETFLKETNLKEKEIKKLIEYVKQGGGLAIKAGEKLEEKASIFALTVVSLGLISSVGSVLGIPGVAIFGTLFSTVAFGGELLQSIPFVKKYLEEHKKLHQEIHIHKKQLDKIDK